METSIRYLQVRGLSGVKPALCFRGRNQAHAVINDQTVIRVISNIPLKQHDDAVIVMGPSGLGQQVYPISLFVQRFLTIGERKAMTERAKFMLKKALEGGIKDDECLPPDIVPGDPNLPPGLRDPIKAMHRGREINERMERTGEDFITAADAPRSPTAPKRGTPPVAPIKRAAGASGALRTAGADIVRKVAAELKLEPTKLRKLLRSKGLSAPYTDEKLIRSKLS